MNVFIKLSYGDGKPLFLRADQIVAIAEKSSGAEVWINGQDDAFFVLESAPAILNELRLATLITKGSR